jgi:hypothetical protein
MPLREALRGLRHVLRKGGEALRDSVTPDALPRPAAEMAGGVLREVEHLARGVDDVTSGVLKRVLGGVAAPGVSLRELSEGDAAAAVFGAAVHAALEQTLDRLGAGDAFVSEATARAVWASVGSDAAGEAPEDRAAGLTLRLVAARPVRGISADATLRVAADKVVPVAVFAVMLWLLSDRPEGEDAVALEASIDIAVALANDVSRAVADGDPRRLAALYAEFAAHV